MRTSPNIVDVHKVGGDARVVDAVMTLRFASDGKYCAAASTSGLATLYSSAHATERSYMTPATGKVESACTVATFHAAPPSQERGYTVLTTTSVGTVDLWHTTPGKSLAVAASALEEGNEIMCADFAPSEAVEFVTGGSDAKLRIYRVTEAGELVAASTIEQGIDHHGQPTMGPPAKIMAVKYVSSNVFLASGWESSTFLYDARTQHPQRMFEGTAVAGSGIDFIGSVLCCVSNRPEKQIQVFDLGSGKESACYSVDNLPLSGRMFGRASRCGVWVCGSKDNAAYCVDLQTGKEMAHVTQAPEALFAVDVNPADNEHVLLAGAHDAVYRVKASLWE